MKVVRLALPILLLVVAQSAGATTLTFQFPGASTGLLGNSQTFTSGTVTITAYGYTGAGVATALYGKNQGGDETGLGLHNDPTGQNEVSGTNFIAVDLTNVFTFLSNQNATLNGVSGSFGSTQGTEYYEYGWDTVGSLSTFGGAQAHSVALSLALTGVSNSTPVFDFRLWPGNTLPNANVLLDNIEFNYAPAIPEPASLLLLGTGLVGLALAVRRRR